MGTSVGELASGLPEGVRAVRREAFRALRKGGALDAHALSARTGLSVPEVDRALAELISVGMAQIDGAGRVVGVAGLGLEPTRHALHLAGVQLFTWCAADAVGIPAALGEDALVRTPCPHCGRVNSIDISRGEPLKLSELALWLPDKAASSVVAEFCPEVNLFCDVDHLESWRAAAGDPPGSVLSMDDVVELGRRWWDEFR